VRINGGPPIFTSLTEAETMRLQELAEGRMVLEVGSAYGYSAIAMAHNANYVVSVDPHAGELSDSLPIMQANIELYRMVRKIGVVIAHSQDFLPILQQAGAKFGLVFIDGDHRSPTVGKDILAGSELIAKTGHIAVHDFGEVTCPDVQDAVERWFPDQGTLIDTLWVR
jgi:predicted O-methyltransferase YrrM